MKKVLTGVGYDLPRLVGIKAEMWCRVRGKEPPITDTQFSQGIIATNSISGNIGLIFDSELEHFDSLIEPHMSRLTNVVENDGWIPEQIIF